MAEFDDIAQVLDDTLNGLRSRANLNKYGLAGIRLIKKRTREGIDVHGQGFQAYSEGHKKKRKAQGLPTQIVNLEFNDVEGMLAQIDHILNPDLDGVEIDILDPEKRRIARYHNIEGAGRSRVKREFFDLNDEERASIVQLVGEDLELALNELSEE